MKRTRRRSRGPVRAKTGVVTCVQLIAWSCSSSLHVITNARSESDSTSACQSFGLRHCLSLLHNLAGRLASVASTWKQGLPLLKSGPICRDAISHSQYKLQYLFLYTSSDLRCSRLGTRYEYYVSRTRYEGLAGESRTTGSLTARTSGVDIESSSHYIYRRPTHSIYRQSAK